MSRKASAIAIVTFVSLMGASIWAPVVPRAVAHRKIEREVVADGTRIQTASTRRDPAGKWERDWIWHAFMRRDPCRLADDWRSATGDESGPTEDAEVRWMGLALEALLIIAVGTLAALTAQVRDRRRAAA